jgi:hypothetical protein
MPKCEVDSALQDQVRDFVSESKLTVSGAAKILGVDRTTFWRFYNTGKARDDTKVQFRDALANRNKKAARPAADDSHRADAMGGQMGPQLPGDLTDREIRRLRRACEGVLTLLNAYEVQRATSLTRKN